MTYFIDMASSQSGLGNGGLLEIAASLEIRLCLFAGKAAQAQLESVLRRTTSGEAAVDGSVLLYTRQNRLMEFSLHELFGADGWKRHLDRFAELAAITLEREMELDGVSMSA
jgi:hypothetical protein